MWCHLNGVHISEAPTFLTYCLSESTYAIQVIDPFNVAHSLIIPLQLSSDVYSPSIAEYDNKVVPRIHLTDKEPPWDPSTEEYSKHETHISDH